MRGHAHFDATHVIFTVPETKTGLHDFSIVSGDKKAAMFDLDLFVDGMDAAVRRWYLANMGSAILKDNLPHLIRYSQTGVLPFTKGHSAIVSGA